MIRPRFIARVSRHGHDSADAEALFRERLRMLPALRVTFDQAPLVLAGVEAPSLVCGDGGIILGSLFARGSPTLLSALPEPAQAEIIASRGAHLTMSYWGPYLAFLMGPAPSSVTVLRAPFGELPCIIHETEDALFLASDVSLLVDAAGYRPSIAWDEVMRHLATRYQHTGKTCLAGLDELQGGMRLILEQGRASIAPVWSPWTFAGRNAQMTDREEAARLLRSVAEDCVAARASEFSSILLMLSGGLDSSLLAACLSRQSVPFEGLNLVTSDAIGDESTYARRVSAVLESALTERPRDVTRIDVRRSIARHLPRPVMRSFLQESERLSTETADRIGADVLFNGGGGDNVFCSLQSGAPVADRLLVEGPGMGVLRTARDMSEFAQASIVEVVIDAARRAWRHKAPSPQRLELDLLSPRARAQIEKARHHPWLAAPTGSLPGKLAHVRLMVYAQSYVECLDVQSERPVVAPLLSQPLVEACLTMPGWFWLDRGHNRMVARQAFADRLPRDIVLRRSKGTPDSFVAQIVEAHHGAIRDLLTEGELARQGLIDLPGVLAILDRAGPLKDQGYDRVLQLVDVEAWAQGWSGSGR